MIEDLWAQTIDGKRFDLVEPGPEMVSFDAMATVLARLPRFGGHTDACRSFLSVAQHSVVGARVIWRETGRADWAAAFLLHEGNEYAVGDIISPVQRALAWHAEQVAADSDSPWFPGEAGKIIRDAIKRLKNKVDAAVYTAAGVPWPLPPETISAVKEYDLRMMRVERDTFMSPVPAAWIDAVENAEPLGFAPGERFIWDEEHSASSFREAFREYFPEINL